jgi:hypothetical protein
MQTPPREFDSWDVKERLFKTIDFRALAHRRLFCQNHLVFDGVHCVGGNVDPLYVRCIDAYDEFMSTYQKLAGDPPEDAKGVLEALSKIPAIFGEDVVFRGDTDFPILMPCGGRLLQGSSLPLLLYQWAGRVATAVRDKKPKTSWDALIELEAIAPFTKFSGSVTKMMWVVIRRWFRHLPAYIPKEAMSQFQRLVAEKNRSLQVRYRQ